MQESAVTLAWGDLPPSAGDCQRVLRALEEGQLVALPTETVYGIAARADDAGALARLRALKGRDPALALTWHIGGLAALERFPRVSPMARRLVERWWPGPLTLVLPGVPSGLEGAARQGWTGVRFPAHKATAQMLARASFPIVATSANLHGAAPLGSADAIAAAFGARLGLILDGGPPRLNEPSIVLKLGPGHFDLLRPGLLDLEQLRTVAGLRIGFVCTGNTCRSPMAEGLARALTAGALQVAPARLRDFGFEFRSMGLSASPGAPAAEHAVRALAPRGIDLGQHRARMAVLEDLARLDRVYALSERHLEGIRMLLPPGADPRIELLDPEGLDVPDPIGGSFEDYRRTVELIERALAARLDEWV